MPIVEDVSQPGEVHGVGTSATCITSRFSPPAARMLLACVTAYTQAGSPSTSVTDSGSHTWTLGPSRTSGQLRSAIYYTYLSASPGSITVSAADSSGNYGLIHLTVRVLAGMTSSQTGQQVNANGTGVAVQGSITPGAANSAVYVAALSAGQQARITALADTYPTHSANFTEVPSCHLTGRALNEVSTAESLGWTVAQGFAWCWSAMEIQNADVAKSGSDTGGGTEPTTGVTRSQVRGLIQGLENGGGSEQLTGGASGTGVTVFKAGSDTSTGTDATGSVPFKYIDVGSADTGTGSETAAGPPILHLSSREFSVGTDDNLAPPVIEFSLVSLGPAVFEGFSLDRAAMLDGSTGAEDGQLYGAQSITLTPDVTASEMIADDDQIGLWFSLNKAVLQVTAGFLPFSVLAAMQGVSVSSFGSSPDDYYGLPMITQYGLNRKSVPVAFRMASRNDYGATRSLVVVLYAVQIGQIEFTGMQYKNGLVVSYTGTVTYSSTDEAGNALAIEEIGRIVSESGAPAGALSGLAFRGV